MKIGFIISVYDEYDITYENVLYLKKHSIPIVLIQSNPNDKNKEINPKSVDHYELLSDLSGSREIYNKELSSGIVDPHKFINKPLGRNFSHAFTAAKNFDVDWWIVIVGDVRISNLNGIKKIIKKMIEKNKSLAVTRAIGQTFLDENGNQTRIQKSSSHDFLSTFFIVSRKFIQEGIFTDIKITNPYCFEQCLGDTATKKFQNHGLDFFDECHIISDYAFPQFIDGLHYNSDRIRLPRPFDGLLNFLRRIRIKFS